MKVLIVLLFPIYTFQALLSPAAISEQWDNFKRTNGRIYSSESEELFRRQLFQKNLQEIEDHNERFKAGLESYEMGVNTFTDFTEEELQPYTMGLEAPEKLKKFFANTTIFNDSSLIAAAVPNSFDWRKKKMVTPVKNQGNKCGSCWAFATIGTLEAHYKIHKKKTAILSEQQLIDCVKKCHGCGGGWPSYAYEYIIKNHGINYEKDYRYKHKNEACKYKSKKAHVTIRSYAHPKGPNETLLKKLVATKGPITVAMDATKLQHYKKGVYYNSSCSSKKFTHAVVIVGYGTEKGKAYWLVKNSWGSKWGEKGYFKIARNRKNHCGIATYPTYPIF